MAKERAISVIRSGAPPPLQYKQTRERGGANLIKTNEFVSIRYNLFLSLANLLFELCEIKMDDQYEMSLARHLSVWKTEFIYRF